MEQRQKQNLIVLITGLLGIVLILVVILLPGRGQGLKSYHNKAYGFSIKYPEAWTLQENLDGAAVIFFAPNENELDFFKESVNVVVQDLSANPLELDAYTELAIKQMELVFENNFILLESGSTSFAGYKAHKIVFLGRGPDVELKYKVAWFVDGLTAYQITYTALSSQYDRYIDKMDKMVRSFRLD